MKDPKGREADGRSHRQPRWILVLAFSVVFAAGGAIGAGVSAKLLHSRIDYYRQHPGRLPDEVVPTLGRILALAPGQEEAVGEIFRRRHASIVKFRRLASAQIHDEFAQMREEIAAELNAEQKGRWLKMARRIGDTFLPPIQEP